MFQDLLQSVTRNAVGMALDGLHNRHMAISANVANAETPGYKAVDVQFEPALQSVLQKANNTGDMPLMATKSGHLGGSSPHATFSGGTDAFQVQTQYRMDGNGVDMDREMAYMAQTSQRFMALSHIEGKMYKSLRGLITNNG